MGSGSGMDRRVERSRFAGLARWRLPMLAAALAAGAGAAAIRFVPAEGTLAVAADTLAVAAVERAPFHDYLPVRGAVAPLRTVYVGAVQGGTVATVAGVEGAAVREGDVLATLSNPQLQLDVSSREAAIAGQLGAMSAQRLALQQGLAADDKTLSEAGYELLKASRDLEIHRSLHDHGFESDVRLQGYQAEARYDAQRLAMLRQARASAAPVAARQQEEIDRTADSLRDNLAVVKASLDALTLRAPVAGRLTDFDLQPGQSLKQGDQIGRIDSLDAWRLDADVDEYYLGRVAEGQHATAELGGAAVALTVARVKPQVVGGRFRAELTFDAATPPGLRRGESAEARVTLGDTRPALVLPNGPWLDGGGGGFVFVLDADGRDAERREITVGRRNPEQVEVASGLEPGERVVTSSYARFATFSRLRIR